MDLISVPEVMNIILNQTEDFGLELVDLEHAQHRVLKEVIVADRDFPPFNRVSMDGIAIQFAQFEKGKTIFNIEGVQAAGSEQLTLQNNNNCIEVMTGAMLPINVDTVIPYELVNIENGIASLQTNNIKFYQNVHKQGKDREKGTVLLEENSLISSAEIGVLATVGKQQIKVAKQPKVAIISTGDELVEVDQIPKPFQIRKSNVHTLVSILQNVKVDSTLFHITDDKVVLTSTISKLLNDFDVLLFSGAVSKGKFDFIPEVLSNLGVEKLFHRVSQRPGKPFWFGKKGKKTVFAFPGNPVSTYVSCLKYFYPWCKKSIGLNYENPNFAVLAVDFTFKPDLTYFLQVKLENIRGTIFATPNTGNGSGDLANLIEADAFLELPKGKTNFKKGEVFNYITYRN